MGQPQGSGFGWYSPTQASMGQLIGGQIFGASFFPASVAVPPSVAQMGQPQGSGFDTYPPGQIGKKQGRARQRRPSSPPASFATPASGGGAQMGQPQGSGFGRYPYRHPIAGQAMKWAPVRSAGSDYRCRQRTACVVAPPAIGVPPDANRDSAGPDRATRCAGGSAADRAACLTALVPVAPARRVQTGLVATRQSRQANYEKGCNARRHLAHWILHLLYDTAICVPTPASQ
jgi:hypothetical protein